MAYMVRFEETGEEDCYEFYDNLEQVKFAIEKELQATYDRLRGEGIPERDIRCVDTYCGHEMWVSGGDYCLTITKTWKV